MDRRALRSVARYGLAAVPALMLLFAPLLANRDEPRVAGFPLFFAWCILWGFLTPPFLYGADRFREKT